MDRDERPGSQLPLHLLCTLECPNFSDTHSLRLCLCLLHHQVQQKQTSGKLFLFCPVSFDETSMQMETSLVKVIDDLFFVKLNSRTSVLILFGPSAALATADPSLLHGTLHLAPRPTYSLVFLLPHWSFLLRLYQFLLLPPTSSYWKVPKLRPWTSSLYSLPWWSYSVSWL